jgi:protein-S-isoprenylcysteine O-methyltransferase Ste14
VTGQRRPSPVQLILMLLLGIVVFAVVVFWPAGTLRWSAGWAYLGVVSTQLTLNLVYLNRVNPELIAYRMRVGPGTKRWDIVWSVLFTPLFTAIYVIAGFDAVRYEWSTMPLWLWPLGLVVFVLGSWLFAWSMGVNPFFEKTVRIQTERGHRVIDTGPYAFVRHPGYVGYFGWSLATPLLLGSWCALGPALLAALAMVIRTALEDRTLRLELDGYEGYARRVRYRLVPGVW